MAEGSGGAAPEPAEGHGGLGLLINNAGVIVQGLLELVPDEELHRQFDVNVYGPMRVTRAFLPLLRAGRGWIINMSAISARMPIPFLGPIAASKAALEFLSGELRTELDRWDIPVTIVQPGAIETQIFTEADSAAQRVIKNVDPALVAPYRDRIDSMARTLESQRPGSLASVVDVALRAAEARRPKDRYVVGATARALALVAKLPNGLRTRAVTRAFGLNV